MPNLFLTLIAYDGWPQAQATLRDGWGARASELEVQDLAKDLSDRQPLAAEKRFDWFMNILRSPEGGIVTDSIIKKKYQCRGRIFFWAHFQLRIFPDFRGKGGGWFRVLSIPLPWKYLREILVAFLFH